MQTVRLIDRVKYGEGLRLTPYPDHRGVWTIGYGTTHFLGRRVDATWRKITHERALEMLYLVLMKSIVSASKSVSNFEQLGDIRQECIAELVYQLGERGWLLFQKTRKYIEEFDFIAAAEEIKDSDLWRDPRTRDRCERYSRMLFLGDSYESTGL